MPIELGFLGLGFAVTAAAVRWRLAVADALRRPLRAFLPWATVEVLLLASALGLLFQPMEMRGTLLG